MIFLSVTNESNKCTVALRTQNFSSPYMEICDIETLSSLTYAHFNISIRILNMQWYVNVGGAYDNEPVGMS